MRAPPKATDHVAEPTNGEEGVIQRTSADGVVDEVKATPAGQAVTMLSTGSDRSMKPAPRALDGRPTRRRSRRKHFSAVRDRDLDRHLADPAGAAEHQHGLARVNRHPVDQPLPGGDENQRQDARLPAC